MLFQTPQWTWKADIGPIRYGFVHNTVNIVPKEGGRVIPAYVIVPTEFFQALTLAFNEEERTHAAIIGMEFYLDKEEDMWIFGVESRDGKIYCDLWPYIQSKIPPWVDLALRKGR